LIPNKRNFPFFVKLNKISGSPSQDQVPALAHDSNGIGQGRKAIRDDPDGLKSTVMTVELSENDAYLKQDGDLAFSLCLRVPLKRASSIRRVFSFVPGLSDFSDRVLIID